MEATNTIDPANPHASIEEFIPASWVNYSVVSVGEAKAAMLAVDAKRQGLVRQVNTDAGIISELKRLNENHIATLRRIRNAVTAKATELVEEGTVCIEGANRLLEEIGANFVTRSYTCSVILTITVEECEDEDACRDAADTFASSCHGAGVTVEEWDISDIEPA
jgi:hypothetical protein